MEEQRENTSQPDFPRKRPRTGSDEDPAMLSRNQQCRQYIPPGAIEVDLDDDWIGSNELLVLARELEDSNTTSLQTLPFSFSYPLKCASVRAFLDAIKNTSSFKNLHLNSCVEIAIVAGASSLGVSGGGKIAL